MVYRVYVEKKAELANEANALLNDCRNLLGISSLEGIRVINCYDAENITQELFDYAIKTVFSEPQLVISSQPAQPCLLLNFCQVSLISGRIQRHSVSKSFRKASVRWCIQPRSMPFMAS